MLYPVNKDLIVSIIPKGLQRGIWRENVPDLFYSTIIVHHWDRSKTGKSKIIEILLNNLFSFRNSSITIPLVSLSYFWVKTGSLPIRHLWFFAISTTKTNWYCFKNIVYFRPIDWPIDCDLNFDCYLSHSIATLGPMFIFARWSHEVVLFLVITTHPPTNPSAK